MLLVFWLMGMLRANGIAADRFAESVSRIDGHVFTSKQRTQYAGAFNRRMRAARDEANSRDRKEWSSISTLQDWERFRGQRLERLRKEMKQSSGERRSIPTHRVVGTIAGERFVIERLAFPSRPGIWVAANLYRPAKPLKSMPVILIAHSHHRWKTQKWHRWHW